MQKKISPEEKLLSIIKGKQNKTNAVKTADPGTKSANAGKGSVAGRIDDYLSALLKNSFLRNSIFDPDRLKSFNKYMAIALACIALYLFFDLIVVRPSRKAALVISGLSASGRLASPAEGQMPIETKNYSHYSNKISGKSIFSAGPLVRADIQDDADSKGKPQGDELGLVGIIPGETVQAIIEDKKNQKTYYLSKGQSVNGITVQDINENKVTLDYKDKTVTLFL